MPDNLESELPLTETILLILLSMSQGPRHGYAILKDVADLSEGRVTLSTGTLYGALARLLEAGFIERLSTAEPEDSTRARKEYRLTVRGQHLLSLEIQRMQSLVSAARLRAVGE